MSHLSSWVQLTNPIDDVGLNFDALFDMFTFDDNIFVTILNMPNAQSNSSKYIFSQKIPYSYD